MQIGRCADPVDREIIMLDLTHLRESLPRARNAYVDSQSALVVRVLSRLAGYSACQRIRLGMPDSEVRLQAWCGVADLRSVIELS